MTAHVWCIVHRPKVAEPGEEPIARYWADSEADMVKQKRRLQRQGFTVLRVIAYDFALTLDGVIFLLAQIECDIDNVREAQR